ncbi:hypothetical protein HQ520_05760 [bacterium]|nr:hypothetical protein [bacterium]
MTNASDHISEHGLAAILADTEDVYARLLEAIERSLQADPEMPANEAASREIETLMRAGDQKFQALRQCIEPWERRSAEYPPDLVDRVNGFLGLLEKGLKGIQGQIDHRVADLRKRRQEVQETLAKLNQQRQGVHGYRQKGNKSRLIKKQA